MRQQHSSWDAVGPFRNSDGLLPREEGARPELQPCACGSDRTFRSLRPHEIGKPRHRSPAIMRGNGGSKGGLLKIADAELTAGLFHNARNGGIVYVRDARKQMVFHLKIQATNHPTEYAIGAGEIHGGFYLMDRPWCVHLLGARIRCRKGCRFHHMPHLEYQRQQHTCDKRSHSVEDQHHTDRMQKKW